MGLSKLIASLVDEGFYLRLFYEPERSDTSPEVEWEAIVWKGKEWGTGEVARGFAPTPHLALTQARERYRVVEARVKHP